MTPTRRAFVSGAAAVTVGALAGCSGSLDPEESLDAEETVTNEYELDGATEVETDTKNGEIELEAEQRETVRVEAKKQATDEDSLDEITLNAKTDNGVLSIVVETETDTNALETPPRIDLIVTVPEGLSIAAMSANGKVTADLTAPEMITAETENSNIEITCEQTNGFDVSTTNGDVELECETAAEAVVETSNGNVVIELPQTAEPAVDLETANGDISVGAFDAGSVTAGSSVEASIGAGAVTIEVKTANGNITLRPR